MIRLLILALSLLMAAAVPLYGAFDDENWTARGTALGNALFADFDPLSGMSYNPASIAMAHSFSSYLDWETPYTALNDGSSINTIHFEMVCPFFNKFTIPIDPFFTKRGAIGLSVYRESVLGPDDSGGTTELYHEGIYSFFYAKDLNDVLSRGAKISVGVKFSIYDIGVGGIQDVTANTAFGGVTERLSFGMDVGMTYDFSETIRLGATYRNLISPGVSILTNGNDSLPGEIRLGGNWDIGDLLFMKHAKLGAGLVIYQRGGLFDGTNVVSDNRAADSSYNVGYEFKQISLGDFIKSSSYKGELLTIRLGCIYEVRTAPLESIIDASCGLGLTYIVAKEHRLQLDYSLVYSINEGNLQQSVGFSYEWLLPNSAFAYKDEVRKELEFEELINKKAEAASNNVKPANISSTNSLNTNSLSNNSLNTNSLNTNTMVTNAVNTNSTTNTVKPKRSIISK
jgi:hypothetical protein